MKKHSVVKILAVITSIVVTDGRTLIEKDIDSIKISLSPDSDNPLQVSENDKPILRYGFHRTYECQNFEKSFICVRKCLSLNYHIAYADKSCSCICYKNKVLAQYQAQVYADSEKHKIEAPTTIRPAWAGGIIEKKPKDYEINANYTEFIEEPKQFLVESVEPSSLADDTDLDSQIHVSDDSSNFEDTTDKNEPTNNDNEPDNNENAPDDNGNAPDDNENAPDENGNAPNDNENAPDENGNTPNDNENAPDDATNAPDDNGNTPDDNNAPENNDNE